MHSRVPECDSQNLNAAQIASSVINIHLPSSYLMRTISQPQVDILLYDNLTNMMAYAMPFSRAGGW